MLPLRRFSTFLPAVFICLAVGAALWLVLWQKQLAKINSDAFETSVFQRKPADEVRLLPDNDPMYWIEYAREVREGKTWRIRWTKLDNPPDGRPMHWAQPNLWLIAAAGTINSWITGNTNITSSTATGSFWVNPFLMMLLVIATTILLAPRIGVVPTGLLAVILPMMPSLAWDFYSLRPGHHSLHELCPFLAVLCIVIGGLGWIARDDRTTEQPWRLDWFIPLALPRRQQARRLFVLAGIFGGAGLWVGATIQYLVFGFALFSINLLYLMAGARASDEAIPEPRLWRLFAVSGAISSVAFYFVEYGGLPFQMRLEVNHPLYALALLGMGEFTFRVFRVYGQHASLRANLPTMIFAAVVGVLPLAIMTMGSPAWHALRDPEMARLHHFIVEFMRYTNGNFKNPLGRFVNSFGVLSLFLLLPLFLSTDRLSKTFEWATLCFSFFFCYLLLVATWFQIRWSGLFSIGLAVLVVVVINAGWRAAVEKRVGRWFPISALVLLILQIGFHIWQIRHDLPLHRQGMFLSANLTNPAQMRNLADALKKVHPEGPVNVMCNPDYSPSLAYFDAAYGVSSFYWENIEGLHRMTRFFTSLEDSEAQNLLKDGNMKYVIVPHEASFEKGCVYIRYGLAPNAPSPERTLLGRLYAKDPKVTNWLVLNQELTAAASKDLILHGSTFRNPIDVYEVRMPNEQNSALP